MKPQTLAIDLIRTDCGTQSRIAINEDTVEDYAETIAASNGDWPFPPLDVFHDGEEYFLAAGFHRILGAQQSKRASVPCIVHQGTAKDARIFGMTANDRNGLRLSRADRRANVEWLLDNGGKMTQSAIAEAAGVTSRTVKSIVADRNPLSIRGKGQVAPNTPSSGDISVETVSAPSGHEEPFGDPPREPGGEDYKRKPQANGTGKGKKFDGSYWFKQWNQGLGPLSRMVDRLAENLGQSQSTPHKAVHKHLSDAHSAITKWLKQ
jgi:hypothetical protein